MQTWDQRQPIYQQLADILAAQLLDGQPPEGDAMPSVRALATRYLLNPLTVNRALQALGDEGLLENRRGLGLFVVPGARDRLKAAERQRFLHGEWPRLRDRLRRLGIGPEHLVWAAEAGPPPPGGDDPSGRPASPATPSHPSTSSQREQRA